MQMVNAAGLITPCRKTLWVRIPLSATSLKKPRWWNLGRHKGFKIPRRYGVSVRVRGEAPIK